MFKETITYEDYNGVERTEDFYFNLSKTELVELELNSSGEKFSDRVQRMIDANDKEDIITEVKNIILLAYGEKSSDGRRFEKSPEITKAFSQTPAFDILYMKLLNDDEYASKFITDLVPKSLMAEVEKQKAISISNKE